MDVALAGMHIMDLNGNILEANDSFCTLLGYSQPEIGDLQITDWNSQYTKDKWQEKFAGIVDKRTLFETTYRRKDGTLIPVEMSALGVIIDGNVLIFASSHQSTAPHPTANQQAEKQLIESEERYRALFTGMTEGVVLVDAEGVNLTCNPSAEHILGLAQADMAGRTATDPRWGEIYENGSPYREEDIPALVALRTGLPQTGKIMGLKRPDADTVWISINAQPLFKPGASRPYAAVITFVDITQRKRTEAALKETETYLNAVLNNAGDPIFVKDNECRLILVNNAFCTMFGLPRNEIIGNTLAENVPPNERKHFLSIDRQVLKDGKPNLCEESLTVEGMPSKTILTSKTRFADAKGNYFLIGVIHDITERKHAEKSLQQNEAQFRNLVESFPSGVLLVNNDGNIELVNRRLLEQFGYTIDELIGQSVDMLVQDKLRQAHSYYRKEYSRHAHPRQMGSGRDLFALRKNGSDFPVEIGLQPLDTPKGKATLATIIDISDRKASEEALRKSEERLRLMTQNVKDYSIIMLDQQGQIVTWNEGAQRLKGYYEEEIIGQPLSRFYTPEDIAANKPAALLELAKAEGRTEDEGWRVRKDGSRFYADVILTSIHDADNKFIGFAKITRDISEKKRAEELIHNTNVLLEQRIAERTSELALAKEQAEQASHAKSEFLSRMSHELRTPMNAILGFSQILEAESLNSEQKDFVHEIYHAGNHLLDLINDLLDISRIESGRMEINIEAVRLNKITSQAAQIIRPLLQHMNLTLIDHCAQDVMLLADATRLKQILVNLLSNAAKYNQHDGRILIDCKTLGAEKLRISITDTGSGISKDNIDRLFIPFERLDKSDDSTIEGTGIGLALSKSIAHLMDGDIGVESTLGQGSTFWIDLPCLNTKDEINITDESQIKDWRLGSVKILYIEDNAANLKLVETILRKQHDLTLITATNGEYGLELARRYQPDMILLDIKLPGLDGFAVLKALQEIVETRHIPVIALSADAMPLDVQRGLDAGFRQYLTKPINATELTETISLFLNAKAR